VKLSEETKEPEKTIPRGLLLAIFISTVLYITVAVSAVSVAGWEKLSLSDAPLADIVFIALGGDAFVFLSVIALFATANTVLLMMLSSSRIIYGMAQAFSLPGVLARVHPERRTPWVAILAVAAFTMLFVASGSISLVAGVTNFMLFVTFIVINGALILLRYREPALQRPFRVPVNIGKLPILPLAGIVSCAFMLLQLRLEVIVIGTVLTAAGAALSLVEMRQ